MSQIQEPEDTTPVETLFPEADSARIQEAFQRLTIEQQQVISLRFFEELPHGEVAKRMHRTANAVRAIQFRALSRMRNLLEALVEQSA